LTTSGGGAVECGLAEFIAAEELGRDEGFWWSPDSTRIAYVETDVSDVPIFRMPGLDERGTPVEQRYPRPGDPNARWILKAVGAGGGEPEVLIRVEEEYLVKAGWAWWDSSWVYGEPRMYVQVASRLQDRVLLCECDPFSGEAREVDTQRDPAWVELNDDLQLCFHGLVAVESGRKAMAFFERLHPLKDKGWMPWHVRKRRQVVSPVADVHGLVGVHAEVGLTRWTSDALGLELCMLDHATGTERVLRSGGWRSYEPSKDRSRFVEVASRAGEPPRITVIDLDGKELVEIARGEPVPDVPKPEFFTIPAEDGTELRAMLLRPAGKGPHPAILHCYGGPGAQMVADRWGGSTYLWHARMAQMGYAILVVDNRGSAGYGDKVLKSVHGRLLDLEVRDQTTAARWLGQQGFVDPARIGIWGWSYGGTLSLMCLLKEPDVFAAAVAVAPVTDWRDYDTAYTERYLGLPAENPDAYAKASPITYAATLRRPLLLAHGIMDDNVHFRHATAFVEAAQKAGAPVETDFYPKGAHGIGGPAERRLLYRRMEAFWRRELQEAVR
jgi:dipeptidyl-peptidase-4